jgi:hypothetical protein
MKTSFYAALNLKKSADLVHSVAEAQNHAFCKAVFDQNQIREITAGSRE